MKRLLFPSALLLLMIPVFFTSCEKDEPLSDVMIGKWDVEYVTQFTYKNHVLTSEYKEYQDAGSLILQFVSGGTGIYSDSQGDYLFTWSLSGNVLSIVNLSTSVLNWNLKMDGDKLVWSYSDTDTEDKTITYEIFFTAHRKN